MNWMAQVMMLMWNETPVLASGKEASPRSRSNGATLCDEAIHPLLRLADATVNPLRVFVERVHESLHGMKPTL